MSGDDLVTKQMADELLKGNSYSWPSLRPFKGKEVERKEPYLFNIFRANQIFDHMSKIKKFGSLMPKKLLHLGIEEQEVLHVA